MPLPDLIARTNRWTINPVIRRFAGRVAPFAILAHRGRRSGKTYRIPIIAFPTDDGFLFALTYGAETDWLKNVTAAGGCTLTWRRREVTLGPPHLFTADPRDLPLPGIVKTILRLTGVNQFVTMPRRD